MITLAKMLRELVGLFVDDGALALAIIAVVVVAGMVVTSMPQASLAAGAVLLLGCLGVLFSSAVKAGHLD